jgi:EAL domain-containing protein (putative c-di-GMP-specific phosphodiesterase class I)
VLHYQLQTSLQDGRICGAEALMRWHHPKRGMISPAEFIPLAEETEAIVAMGEWALRTACRDAAAGRIPGTVAVNLSPVQFGRDDLAEIIHAILLDTGLSPKRLEVEVTESTVMSDQSRGLHILRKLKAMGITVAMDDFGTGHSSLAYLQRFPFDTIKIDQSFVRTTSRGTRPVILKSIIALAHDLGMDVVAEGAETDSDAVELYQLGCEYAQGFAFGEPMDADAAMRLLTEERLEAAS